MQNKGLSSFGIFGAKIPALETGEPQNVIGRLVPAFNPVSTAAMGKPGVPGNIIMLAFITFHRRLSPLRALSKKPYFSEPDIFSPCYPFRWLCRKRPQDEPETACCN